MIDCSVRLIGSEGRIDVTIFDPGPEIELIVRGSSERIEFEHHDPLNRAVEHVVESLDAGTEPRLSARRALNSMEIVFGTYESARKRGRVDRPLEVADNPLASMIEDGEIGPESGGESSAE